MKKLITFLIVITLVFTGLIAQVTCGLVVDMQGTGMHSNGTALLSNTLWFSNISTIDSIVVEAIYKGEDAPVGNVNFTSPLESVDVAPMALDFYTKPTMGSYNPNVFRLTMQPAEWITLNNSITYPDGIWSFAAYVYLTTGEDKFSQIAGEHSYFYVNGIENPAVQVVSIPPSDEPRDITINMGVTELNNDTRVGYFVFTAGTYMDNIELTSYDPELGISYTIEQITLPNIPGDVTEILITGYSPAKWEPSINMYNGDSYIAGRAVLTIDCKPEKKKDPKPLCTYTQGFYGNAGGKTCWGLSTTELLMELLNTDLIIGGGSNTLTINSGNIDCLYRLLPGGGPSVALNGEASCDNLTGITTDRRGGIRNTLLSQTITLSLNFRLSPDMHDILIDPAMTTQDIENCMDPESQGIEGTEQEFYLPESVVNFLGEGATLGDILELANKALAGENVSPLSLSEISDAATKINEGFDECRVLLTDHENGEETLAMAVSEFEQGDGEGEGEEDGAVTEDYFGNMEASGSGNNAASEIYPNPVISTSILEVSVKHDDNAYIAIYDLSGKELFVMYDNYLNANQIYRLPIPANGLKHGLYVLKIITSSEMETKVFSVIQ